MIINLQKSGSGKVRLTKAFNFISSTDVDGGRIMHLKSDNKELMIFDNGNDVVNKTFKSLLSRYQNSVETSMRRSDFIFDLVQLLCYKCYNINVRRGRSYIQFPDWMKNKKQQ